MATTGADEYGRPSVYDRVPSLEAIQRLQETQGMTPATAMRDELTAAVRASLLET